MGSVFEVSFGKAKIQGKIAEAHTTKNMVLKRIEYNEKILCQRFQTLKNWGDFPTRKGPQNQGIKKRQRVNGL